MDKYFEQIYFLKDRREEVNSKKSDILDIELAKDKGIWTLKNRKGKINVDIENIRLIQEKINNKNFIKIDALIASVLLFMLLGLSFLPSFN